MAKLKIHALHIGKTAGTQLRFAARHFNKTAQDVEIQLHGHAVRISDLPDHAPYFFTIRDPIARFLSAFYGRKREDKPRHNAPWQPREAASFARFDHANELAEALFERGKRGEDAALAMLNIGHLWRDQADWARGTPFFLETHPPIAILRQWEFEADLRALFLALDAEAEFALTTNADKAHQNDYTETPPLSEKALENLQIWYAQDIEFIRLMEKWRDAHLISSLQIRDLGI